MHWKTALRGQEPSAAGSFKQLQKTRTQHFLPEASGRNPALPAVDCSPVCSIWDLSLPQWQGQNRCVTLRHLRCGTLALLSKEHTLTTLLT